MARNLVACAIVALLWLVAAPTAHAMYSPTLGRFINRDPGLEPTPGSSDVLPQRYRPEVVHPLAIGHIAPRPYGGRGYHDGMNLYSSYFVPNGLDPTGTECGWIICCRDVRVDANDDWATKTFGPIFRHCDLRKADSCGSGEVQYETRMRKTGSMTDPKKSCCDATCADVDACLKKNGYNAGGGTFGDNCQSNTGSRLSKCCLSSNWEPSVYGGPRSPNYCDEELLQDSQKCQSAGAGFVDCITAATKKFKKCLQGTQK